MLPERSHLVDLLHCAFAVDRASRNRGDLDRAMAATAQLSAALDAQRLVFAEVMTVLSVQPEADLVAGLRGNRREAVGLLDRLHIVERAPQLGEALQSGRVGGGHVDQFGSALRRLEPEQRRRVLADTDAVVQAACTRTVDEFGEFLKQLQRALDDDDGVSRLERQRRAVRLKSWVDRDDGMHHWRLTVDPQTGLDLTQRLRVSTEALFHGGGRPVGAPDDPMERESFLRAHALIGLITGGGVRMARPEVVVVEDRRVPAGCAPVIDWGPDVDLPAAEYDAVRSRAIVHEVVLDGGRVVSAPGPLDVGRRLRLATAAQRRVLRALYQTCAWPGCAVPFDDTTPHHVRWWRPPFDGRTDLANLLPLCVQHHHAIHDGGWTVTLDDDRRLTVRSPAGRTMNAEPNRRGLTARLVDERASAVEVVGSSRRSFDGLAGGSFDGSPGGSLVGSPGGSLVGSLDGSFGGSPSDEPSAQGP